jgi:hypothetical protein
MSSSGNSILTRVILARTRRGLQPSSHALILVLCAVSTGVSYTGLPVPLPVAHRLKQKRRPGGRLGDKAGAAGLGET